MFKPRYYFILVKYGQKKHNVTQVMYLRDGKFRLSHEVRSEYLLTWFQMKYYLFLFWFWNKMGSNSILFYYQQPVTGRIHVKKSF